MKTQMGMQDYQWATGMNRLTFTTLGIWPNVNKKHNKNSQNLLVIFEIFFVTICFVIPQIYALILVRGNMVLVIDNVMSSIECFMCPFKIIIMWHKRGVLLSVLESFIEDWCLTKLEWERNIMLKEAQRGRVLTLCGYIFAGTSLISFLMMPLFGISTRTLSNVTDPGNFALPYPAYYPIDYSKSSYITYCYLTQIVGSCIVSICFTCPVSFFGTLVFHTCGQLKILGMKVEKLHIQWSSRSNGTSMKRLDLWIGLQQVVNNHVRILRIISDIESYYSLLVLVQMLSLPVMMCSIGFQISNILDNNSSNTSLTQFLILLTIMLTTLMHIFGYCLVGEVLAHYSLELHDCIYRHKWYLLSGRTAMNLVPVMTRTRNFTYLTAGKFVYLNLETFCEILKSCAGYTSMLIAVRDK